MTEIVEAEGAVTLVAPPRPEDALAVFASEGTAKADRIIDVVRAKIREFEQMRPDVSTPAGRAVIKAFAHRIAKSKAAIEEVGAALAKEQKEIPKRIDANRRHFKETLDKLRDEVRKPLTDWEAAEEARLNEIKRALAELEDAATDTAERSSEWLRDRLGNIEVGFADVSAAVFGDYAAAAAELKTNAVECLQARIAQAEKREADAAELARLRVIQAQREREDHERKIADEAAARAKAEAADALARAERDRAAAEQRAAQAERDKAAAEERARARALAEARAAEEAAAAEQRRREEDRAHRATVNKAALEALVAEGVDVEVAKQVIVAIATGKVPAVSIRY